VSDRTDKPDKPDKPEKPIKTALGPATLSRK